VKIRGFRIELGEIESQLMQAPEVRACAVVSREDEPGRPRLVAYLVLQGSAPGEGIAQLLRDHLARTLPDYMIPGAYVVLESLPLTPHGKLDSAKLPAPQSAAYARQQYLAPRSALEEHLAGLWQQNLGLPCVGIEDNYFAIGGDSIRSLALATAARNAGIAFQVKDLFVHPTIASLAAAISGGALATTPTPLPEPLDLLTAEEKHALMDQFT
jgi:aryl carrier-like protein